MAKEVTEAFNKVRFLLEQEVKYRNSDELLVVRFWWDELSRMKMDGRKISALDFLNLYSEGRITKSDTITRARRLVNQTFPHTIGESHRRRAKKQGELTNNITNLKNKLK